MVVYACVCVCVIVQRRHGLEARFACKEIHVKGSMNQPAALVNPRHGLPPTPIQPDKYFQSAAQSRQSEYRGSDHGRRVERGAEHWAFAGSSLQKVLRLLPTQLTSA